MKNVGETLTGGPLTATEMFSNVITSCSNNVKTIRVPRPSKLVNLNRRKDRTMKKWWFTFGFSQGHDNGYVVIEAVNAELARAAMIKTWGTKWAIQYDSAEAAGVEEYGLHEVK